MSNGEEIVVRACMKPIPTLMKPLHSVDIASGQPVLAMIVEGDNAVKGMRIIMGATKFEEAAAGTIRGDYACCTSENLIHGSDSVENAEIEIKRFFGDR